MRYIVSIILLVLMTTIVCAGTFDTKVKLNVTTDGSRRYCYVSIDLDRDTEFDSDERNLISLEANRSDNESYTGDYGIRVNEVSGEQGDVINLTKTLLEMHKETETKCYASNLSQEFIDCIDGRARVAPIHEQCRLDRDQYKNESYYLALNLSESQSNTTQCMDTVNNKNQEISELDQKTMSLQTQIKDLQNKPLMWGAIAFIIGIIASTMYHKSKYPSSEAGQFGEG